MHAVGSDASTARCRAPIAPHPITANLSGSCNDLRSFWADVVAPAGSLLPSGNILDMRGELGVNPCGVESLEGKTPGVG